MREAFERIEAKSNGLAAASGQGTTRPSVPQTAADPTRPAGTPTAPVPPDVHAAALNNARVKAVAEYRQQYGWAEKVPQQTFQQVASFLSTLHSDPIGYVTNLIGQIEAHPTFGPQWKARHANGNGNGNGHQAPNLDPDVEVYGPDGKPVGATYSAERQKALLKHELDQALKPFQTEREQRQQAERTAATQREQAAIYARNEKQATAQIEEIKGILDVTDDTDPLLTEVLNVWAAHERDGWSAHRAAIEVRKTKVQPRQQGQAVQAAETEMRRKAAGNTVNGTGSTAMPTRPKNVKELAKWLEANASRSPA
jgi:hypothetical protein